MSLLRFTSCRGAETPAVVWIESTQIALIVPQVEMVTINGVTSSSKNITAIFLHSGVKAHVMEDSETVAKTVGAPTDAVDAMLKEMFKTP